jgi:hypothetical protein
MKENRTKDAATEKRGQEKMRNIERHRDRK